MPSPPEIPAPATANAAGDPLAEFYLADQEVSRELFQTFMNDDLYPDAEKPLNSRAVDTGQAGAPVQNVSWVDAVLFCNWLSRRTGRRPCYLRGGAYDLPAADVTLAARQTAAPTDRNPNYGFRVALNAVVPDSEAAASE